MVPSSLHLFPSPTGLRRIPPGTPCPWLSSPKLNSYFWYSLGCSWHCHWHPHGRREGGNSQRAGQASVFSPQHPGSRPPTSKKLLWTIGRSVPLSPIARSPHCYHSPLPPGGLAWFRVSWSRCFAWKHIQLLLSFEESEPIFRWSRSLLQEVTSFHSLPSPEVALKILLGTDCLCLHCT